MPSRLHDSQSVESLITSLVTVMRCPGWRLPRKRGTLAEERPDLVKQWVDEANKDYTPDTVGTGSGYCATWQCGCSCKHCSAPHPSWQATIPNRRKGTNCPYCSGRRVCVCQSIAALYPDLVTELDPGSSPELDPNSVGPGSQISASWVCTMHGSWVSQVCHRVRGSGCPSCSYIARSGARPGRGLLKDECPEIFAQVHPALNGDLKALDRITCGSDVKLWWLCKEDKNRPQGCQHEHVWQTTVAHRCRLISPSGCPFCTGRQVCHCNSISKLRPELLRFWDYSKNSTINPDHVGLARRDKVWWHHECRATNEEHVWQASVYNILRRDQNLSGRLCPICQGRAHKTIIHMGRLTKIKM